MIILSFRSIFPSGKSFLSVLSSMVIYTSLNLVWIQCDVRATTWFFCPPMFPCRWMVGFRLRMSLPSLPLLVTWDLPFGSVQHSGHLYEIVVGVMLCDQTFILTSREKFSLSFLKRRKQPSHPYLVQPAVC